MKQRFFGIEFLPVSNPTKAYTVFWLEAFKRIDFEETTETV